MFSLALAFDASAVDQYLSQQELDLCVEATQVVVGPPPEGIMNLRVQP